MVGRTFQNYNPQRYPRRYPLYDSEKGRTFGTHDGTVEGTVCATPYDGRTFGTLNGTPGRRVAREDEGKSSRYSISSRQLSSSRLP